MPKRGGVRKADPKAAGDVSSLRVLTLKGQFLTGAVIGRAKCIENRSSRMKGLYLVHCGRGEPIRLTPEQLQECGDCDFDEAMVGKIVGAIRIGFSLPYADHIRHQEGGRSTWAADIYEGRTVCNHIENSVDLRPYLPDRGLAYKGQRGFGSLRGEDMSTVLEALRLAQF